ncbi:MAG TPA: VOC family protein [Polyangia bacterium]|jgi:catechol 2,3-dioxygenase-like lactoylglutathione lyase family enzyme
MTRIPSGTELARPFIPTPDFERSKRFYEALGFEKLLDGEVAIFRAGSGGFILQRHDEPAANLMMQLMVDDLDAWWSHIGALDLASRFRVKAPQAPATQPWGLRVAFLVDPAGVLWHVAERREGAVQDR